MATDIPMEWSRDASRIGCLWVDASGWAEENFGTCDLGDARRTRRAAKVAEQMAQHPDGGTPAQTENWADLKAVYRLFDVEDVTFSALAEPHWKQARAEAASSVLPLGDQDRQERKSSKNTAYVAHQPQPSAILIPDSQPPNTQSRFELPPKTM